MNKAVSPLEQHAGALGLAQEDAALIQRVTHPVDTADKALLGVACCVLAAGSAALSVWMVVPTLLISGTFAMALVHFVNSARTLSLGASENCEVEDDDVLRRMSRASAKELDEWNRDTFSNPMFRSSLSNIGHDDRRRH